MINFSSAVPLLASSDTQVRTGTLLVQIEMGKNRDCAQDPWVLQCKLSLHVLQARVLSWTLRKKVGKISDWHDWPIAAVRDLAGFLRAPVLH